MSQFTRFFGVKFHSEDLLCVNKLTFRNSGSEWAEQSCQLIICIVIWLLAQFRVLSGHKNLDCIQQFDVKSVAQGNDFDAFAL